MKRMKLQNGSDIRGIALSTADLTADLTEDAVKEIACGPGCCSDIRNP